MRILMWFAVGFAAACALGAYLGWSLWLLLTIPLLALVLVLTRLDRRALCILVGLAVGIGWFAGFYYWRLQPAKQADGYTKLLTIEVTEYSRTTEHGTTAEGRAKINGRTYSVQFYLNEDVPLAPGDRVEGGFRLRYTAGGAQRQTYHRGDGIFLLCYPKGSPDIIPAQEGSIASLPAVLRHSILSLLEQILPSDTLGFAQALLLGERSELPFQLQWDLKTSGIYHIAAVSGMHMSILFAVVHLLCWKKRFLTALFGYPVLLLFAAVAGFTPSIVRACVMQGLMLLALLVDMEYDPPTALAAAVLVILGINPLAFTSVGFQLSVGCMMGILLFAEKIHDFLLKKTRLGPVKGSTRKAKCIRAFVASVSVTLGAMSLSSPLCALYFGNISVAGILTNLLTLWLISVIFYGLMAACILGALWLPLGIAVGWVCVWPIRLVLWVSDMIAQLPASAIYTNNLYTVLFLALCAVLLIVYYKSKKKHPVVLTCCIAAGLICALICTWLEPRRDDYRLTAVDVGQGQCLILQSMGKHYVVDCGGDSGDDAATQAAQNLRSQGIFRLDGLIVTHYDADHAGGVAQLLSVVPADALYLPTQTPDNPIRQALEQEFGEIIRWVNGDIALNDADITIFAAADTPDSNEGSLCILFQPQDCDILITGDRSEEGEQALMAHTRLPDLEILIAGHHGSRTSTSWELLNATRPEIVIISVGEDNRYGHPTWETLQRLELFGCDVYRTDLAGTLIFRG